MSIDIGQYIEYLLWQKGQVSLPGIGTICYHHISAYLEKGKTEIHPPKVSFSLEDYNEDEDNSLVKLIQGNENIDVHTAENAVSKYAEKVLNVLLNYGIVKVAHIGYLEKKNGSTEFIPAESTLHKAYQGLKPLEVSPLQKNKIPVAGTIASPVGLKKEDNFFAEILNVFASLIIGGIMIMAFHYFIDPYGDKQHFKRDVSTVKTENSVEKSVQQIEQKSRISEEIPGGLEESAIIDENDSSATSILPMVTDLVDTTTKQDNLPEKQIPPDIVYDDLTGEEKNTSSDNENSSINLAKPKKDQACIILVDVYTNTLHALKKVDQIKAAGYIAYRDETYDTHRVGVQFKCAERDPEEMIKEIRRKFGQNARFLYPRLSI